MRRIEVLRSDTACSGLKAPKAQLHHCIIHVSDWGRVESRHLARWALPPLALVSLAFFDLEYSHRLSCHKECRGWLAL